MTAANLARFYQGLLHNPDGVSDADVLRNATTNIRCTFPDPLLGVSANRTMGLVRCRRRRHARAAVRDLRTRVLTGRIRSHGRVCAGGVGRSGKWYLVRVLDERGRRRHDERRCTANRLATLAADLQF